MALDPAALNALTASWAAQKAELDDSENRSRINYNNALDQLRRSNTQAMGRIGVNMADRGLTHSGIAGQEMMKQQDDANRNSARLAEQQNLALTSVARRRLEADAQYNAQRALAEQNAYKEQQQMALLRG